MSESLSGEELAALVERVFRPGPADRALAILVDLPDALVEDRAAWAARRDMAVEWARRLAEQRARTGIEVALCLYQNARRNNADLPERAWLLPTSPGPIPAAAEECDPGRSLPFSEVFRAHSLLIAPTEFSATAPLKMAAPKFGFRAATMPGFCREMIPALRLDYGEVNRRVLFLKDLLDRAELARVRFVVDGRDACELRLDLRHRLAHASGGLLPEPGTAGNLPSGEAYIVPYEGEIAGDPSRTCGVLPVQFGGEVVRYRVEGNRAVAVLGAGASALREKDLLAREPAYGNLAELGLGVLADLGVLPCGEILLDEKLGLHIAFGRSEHFGGQVGPAQFSRPEAVVHIDRVYLPSMQPRVSVRALELTFTDGGAVTVLAEDRYAVAFPA
ncbi:MAG: hypothetical protein HY812_07245 [Planctomycetes bacterium]|nr:hypothetical protein [Planctomycetota bacterium]